MKNIIIASILASAFAFSGVASARFDPDFGVDHIPDWGVAQIAKDSKRFERLEKKSDKLKAGIAGSTAIAGLTQYTGHGNHHVAVGVGGYDGAAALAAGYTHKMEEFSTVRATLALDTENELSFGISVGHSW